MNFSPKKLRISTTELLSDVTQLMGKWAYTVRILYSNPLVTPRIMLETWEHTVLTAAISFIFPDHLHVQSQMFETADKFATGSNTCYSPGIYFKGDSFGHLDGLRNQNLLHLSAFRIHAAPRTVATVKTH